MAHTNEVTPQQAETSGDVWADALPQLLKLGISPDPHVRTTWLAAMTGDELVRLIGDIHTAVAPDEKHTPHEGAMYVQLPDGSNRQELMAPDDRRSLLGYAATLVSHLAERRTSPDDDAAFLKRSANVIGLAIVMAHMYEEANDRTARTAAQLIREGLDTADTEALGDMKLLSTQRPEDRRNTFPSYVPINDGINLQPTQLLEVAAALDIPLGDNTAYLRQGREAYMTPYADQAG